MNNDKSPSEFARETLKRLATRHMAPTPENYQACYNEIANLPEKAPFPEQKLRSLAAALPATSMKQKELLAALGFSITQRSWQAVENALVALFIDNGAEVVQPSGKPIESQVVPAALAHMLANFIESVLPAINVSSAAELKFATNLMEMLRQDQIALESIQELLATGSHQLLLTMEEQGLIKHTLLRLLQLIIENIGELSLDDSWLRGQIEGLLETVKPPLTLQKLDLMETRLQDVIAKQSQIKQEAVKAQEQMRDMLSSFVKSLAAINNSSTHFQEKLEASALEIEGITRIDELGPVLKDLIAATHSIAAETGQTRQQLRAMQQRVAETEAELTRLYKDLSSASLQARNDPLTDTLNRKGLDEAILREMATAQRTGQPLSICMIDLDNFKKLNDGLGHEYGDMALVHFADVARSCMRPSDSLSRYGGEEFVILMPDSTMPQGVDVITRLQRALTKAFFLEGEKKRLITFSAGVVQFEKDESGTDAIKRADRAMYLAKRAGKNRVIGG